MRSLADLTDEQLGRLTPEQIARSDENKAPVAIAVGVILMTVAVFFCLLRFYVRMCMSWNVGKDDWAVLASLMLTIIYVVTTLSKLAYGWGHHMWLLTLGEMTAGTRISNAHLIIYQIAFSSIKVAFLLQYRRVFDLPNPRRICAYMIVFVGLFATSQVLVLLFGCIPIEKIWNPFIEAKCIDRITFWYVNAVVNLITDVAIFILPMPLVRILPLPFLQKMVLVSVFSIGFFVTGISIIRITYLIPAARSMDLSYDTIDCSLWTVGEICGALVCVCIPTLRPLVRRFLGGTETHDSHPSNPDIERGGPSMQQCGRSTPLHVRKARHWADADSDSDAGLNLGLHQAVITTTITANKHPVRASVRSSVGAGVGANVGANVGASAITLATSELSGVSSSSGRTGNDTFWLGEDSDIEDMAEAETPTPLRAPPRTSILVTSPVEGHAELPAEREPAELSAEQKLRANENEVK